jgi:hypothetical protein
MVWRGGGGGQVVPNLIDWFERGGGGVCWPAVNVLVTIDLLRLDSPAPQHI